MIEYFIRSGNIPCVSILLNIKVRGDKIYGALFFKIIVDISSYPYESLDFKDFIILLISLVVVG